MLSIARLGAVDAAFHGDDRAGMAAALERRGPAPDLGEAFAPEASILAVAQRHDISMARIYTRRNKLLQLPDLTECVGVVVDDGERQNAHGAIIPAIILDLGSQGRVSISASAPAALVSAALKAPR